LVFISQYLADERTTRNKHKPLLKTAEAEKPGGFCFSPCLFFCNQKEFK